jgi:hypothetical protein
LFAFKKICAKIIKDAGLYFAPGRSKMSASDTFTLYTWFPLIHPSDLGGVSKLI